MVGGRMSGMVCDVGEKNFQPALKLGTPLYSVSRFTLCTHCPVLVLGVQIFICTRTRCSNYYLYSYSMYYYSSFRHPLPYLDSDPFPIFATCFFLINVVI